MDKKMYFAPEVEEVEVELQGLLCLSDPDAEPSTDNGDNNSDDIIDI